MYLLYTSDIIVFLVPPQGRGLYTCGTAVAGPPTRLDVNMSLIGTKPGYMPPPRNEAVSEVRSEVPRRCVSRENTSTKVLSLRLFVDPSHLNTSTVTSVFIPYAFAESVAPIATPLLSLSLFSTRPKSAEYARSSVDRRLVVLG